MSGRQTLGKGQSGMANFIDRRGFVQVAGAAGLAALVPSPFKVAGSAQRSPYSGPNVVIVRFGGGVRRRETIDPQHTFAPYLRHELVRRGTLYPQMEISNLDGVSD